MSFDETAENYLYVYIRDPSRDSHTNLAIFVETALFTIHIYKIRFQRINLPSPQTCHTFCVKTIFKNLYRTFHLRPDIRNNDDDDIKYRFLGNIKVA